jgi:hypothetical protein
MELTSSQIEVAWVLGLDVLIDYNDSDHIFDINIKNCKIPFPKVMPKR